MKYGIKGRLMNARQRLKLSEPGARKRVRGLGRVNKRDHQNEALNSEIVAVGSPGSSDHVRPT